MPFASSFMVACLALTTQEAQQYPETYHRTEDFASIAANVQGNNAYWFEQCKLVLLQYNIIVLHPPPSPVFGNFVECVTGMQRCKGVFINGQTEL